MTTMQHAFDQLLRFLQQGISAIFHFVQMLWSWSVGQIAALLAVPWQQWPLWKQILLVLVLAGVIWALYRAVKELFEATERILAAFASLLSVLVRSLPSVVLAGLIALGGVWLMNHLGNGPLQLPAAYNPFYRGPSPTAASRDPAAVSNNPRPAATSSSANRAPVSSSPNPTPNAEQPPGGR
jgi:hypothetical protein